MISFCTIIWYQTIPPKMSMQNKWYANQNYTNQPFVSIDVPHRKAVWLKTFLLIFPDKTLSNLMNQWCIYRLCNMCTLVHRAFEILLHFQHLQSDHQVLLNFLGECKFVTPICLTRPRCGCTLLPKENGRYFRLLLFSNVLFGRNCLYSHSNWSFLFQYS